MDDSSDSDINQSDLIDTDQTATDERLVSELIILIPTLPEISQEKFSQFDLRADGKAKIIADQQYR